MSELIYGWLKMVLWKYLSNILKVIFIGKTAVWRMAHRWYGEKRVGRKLFRCLPTQLLLFFYGNN